MTVLPLALALAITVLALLVTVHRLHRGRHTPAAVRARRHHGLRLHR